LTGQPVPPDLPATAKAWHAGVLDGEHLRVIERFFRDLPEHVHTGRRRRSRGISGRARGASAAHHVEEWADGGLTNIDKLTFACKSDHKLLKPGGWTTRKLKDGSTQWLPPPHLPLRGGINDYHHPERMIPEDWDLAGA
jgi:hypothetical protein